MTVATGKTIAAIEATGQQLAVSGSDGFKAQADTVLVAVGVRPSISLRNRQAQSWGCVTRFT